MKPHRHYPNRNFLSSSTVAAIRPSCYCWRRIRLKADRCCSSFKTVPCCPPVASRLTKCWHQLTGISHELNEFNEFNPLNSFNSWLIFALLKPEIVRLLDSPVF